MRRLAFLLLVGGALAACDDDMGSQEKIQTYEASTLFADGVGMRKPVPGTLAVEDAASDAPMPTRITEELLARGGERYGIFCTPCHGALGDGLGMIVQRGFPQPPSFHVPRLRDAPARHYYDVITRGYGAMYAYAARVPPADRWAIVAHVRALQASRNVAAAALPPALRDELRREAGR